MLSILQSFSSITKGFLTEPLWHNILYLYIFLLELARLTARLTILHPKGLHLLLQSLRDKAPLVRTSTEFSRVHPLWFPKETSLGIPLEVLPKESAHFLLIFEFIEFFMTEYSVVITNIWMCFNYLHCLRIIFLQICNPFRVVY